MGLLDNIDALNLSDEQKQQLRQEYQQEVDPLRDRVTTLEASDREERVEREIEDIGKPISEGGFGFAESSPGTLAWLRRLWLSDDGEVGVVMLADNELGLSGDKATGARGREELSTGDAVRKVFELWPRKDGKIAVNLADQINENGDHDKPDDGDKAEEAEARRKRVEKTLGRPVRRGRSSRYRQGGMVVNGGDN